MKIVVDTNIVFSGILNSESRIGKIVISSSKYIELYSCEFLKFEIKKHRSKLLKITKLTESELDEVEELITGNIHFLNELLIPRRTLLRAETLLNDIDINDTPFLALADHLQANLWTGDKVLIEGLRRKQITSLVSTSELAQILSQIS